MLAVRFIGARYVFIYSISIMIFLYKGYIHVRAVILNILIVLVSAGKNQACKED